MTIPQNNIAIIPEKKDTIIINIDEWKSPIEYGY